MDSLYIIDGFSLAYRGHFAMLRSPRITSAGVNTSSILVFANVLVGLIERESPDYLVAVFDTSSPTFRHAAYAEYKAGRDAMPEDLATAIPLIKQMLEAFAVPSIALAGWEADDLAATLAHRAEEAGVDTYLVTSDKDYDQLVTARTKVCKPAGAGEQYEVLGEEEILQKWKIDRVDQVVDILALMGDKADNVPGVPGVGEKTAQKLIGQFGTVEKVLEATDQLKGKQRERLELHADDARMSKELVTLRRDAPLEVQISDLGVRPHDPEKVHALFTELEFQALTERVLGDTVGALPQKSLSTIEDTPHRYVCVSTPSALEKLEHELAGCEKVAFDIETTGLDVKECSILGAAFSFEPGSGFYVPFEKVGKAGALKVIARLMTSDVLVVGHNLKFDLSVLRWHGIRATCSLFDTMLATAVCMPDQRRRLDDLAERLLGYGMVSIEELIGARGTDQRSLRDVSLEDLVEYAVEDADIALQLAEVLRARVVDDGLERVLFEVECPLIPVLVEMEFEGIRLDRAQLEVLSAHLADEIATSRDRVQELAGESVDLNSARQLGAVLFDKLKLDPRARRTPKTGQYRTSEPILRRLESRHEIVGQILNFRMCSKLKSVYVSQLPGTIYEPTGRVHTQYDQASIVTGRMQSNSPNLQTIPVRTEMGRRIRAAFVPRDEDHVLLSADYSQIELRIAAELSRDEHMLATFEQGADIHTTTAARINGVEVGEVTDEMRQQAKMVNFGIIYGISAFGLAERLNVARATAAELIEQYFLEYPGIASYIEETLTFARDHEYVVTMLGRRRYVPNINSRNRTARQADERNAINSRIQGTGADMIKAAMVNIHLRLRERSLRTRMLLQVHDELVFDVPRDEIETVRLLVDETMRDAIPMSVPIEVGIGFGGSWLAAH